jgi:hypothetical protein
MYCSKCGSENSEDAAFCNSCGSNLKLSETNLRNINSETNVSSEKPKKKMSLGLIAGWFFGIIFLLQGISYTLGGPFVSGICLLVASVITLPPLNNSLQNKINVSLSRGLRIFLVFLLLIFASAGAAADVASNNNDDTNPSSSSATVNEPTYYSVGDKVTVGDIAYTVNDARTASSVGNSFASEQADGIFIIVDLTIENMGDESADISSSYIKVIDSQGRTFESDEGAWIYLDNNLLFKQLQPGLPTNGQTIFDVPEGESFILEVTDSFWGSNTKYITLGST